MLQNIAPTGATRTPPTGQRGNRAGARLCWQLAVSSDSLSCCHCPSQTPRDRRCKQAYGVPALFSNGSDACFPPPSLLSISLGPSFLGPSYDAIIQPRPLIYFRQCVSLKRGSDHEVHVRYHFLSPALCVCLHSRAACIPVHVETRC